MRTEIKSKKGFFRALFGGKERNEPETTQEPIETTPIKEESDPVLDFYKGLKEQPLFYQTVLERPLLGMTDEDEQVERERLASVYVRNAELSPTNENLKIALESAKELPISEQRNKLMIRIQGVKRNIATEVLAS